MHLTARSGDLLEGASREIRSSHQVDAQAHPLDLSRRGAAEELAERCGDVDILVNNAGAIPGGDIDLVDEGRWREAWDLKVFGYINTTRQFYRRMRERGHGVIVNVIGLAGEKFDSGYIAGTTGNASLMAFTARDRQHQHRPRRAHPRREPRRGRDRPHPHAAHHPRGVGARRRVAVAGASSRSCRSAARHPWRRSRTSWCSSPRSARATSAASSSPSTADRRRAGRASEPEEARRSRSPDIPSRTDRHKRRLARTARPVEPGFRRWFPARRYEAETGMTSPGGLRREEAPSLPCRSEAAASSALGFANRRRVGATRRFRRRATPRSSRCRVQARRRESRRCAGRGWERGGPPPAHGPGTPAASPAS